MTRVLKYDRKINSADVLHLRGDFHPSNFSKTAVIRFSETGSAVPNS
jgi:hypothetical protein